MRELWAKWWAAHGTKILGFGTAAFGTLTAIDHETINIIGETFGPKWGPHVVHVIIIAAGFSTARRGFSNTNRTTP